MPERQDNPEQRKRIDDEEALAMIADESEDKQLAAVPLAASLKTFSAPARRIRAATM